MAISGQQIISIGLQNESANSDSLFTAFNKTVNNFSILFACASPTIAFANGLGTIANTETANVVRIDNAGVVNIVAGTNITVSEKDANGNVTINATGGNGNGSGGTVTSVGVTSNANVIVVTNSPITSSGNIAITLANTGVTPGTYIYPTMQVDQFGRVLSIANSISVGTVTSVGLVASGTGLLISGGPITSNGNITVTNTGVVSLAQGAGISLSGSNGNVTISSTLTGGTVTSVGVSSNTLTVTNSTVTTTGTINIESPIGSSSENLAPGAAANLSVTASYFTTTTASTATLVAGTAGLIKTFMMVADGGDMVITVSRAGWKTSGTGTITFNDIGDGCTLQYINSKWFCIGQNGVTFG
jgi:filamentous hemagglutinin